MNLVKVDALKLTDDPVDLREKLSLTHCDSLFSTYAVCQPPAHPQTNWLLMWDCRKIPQVGGNLIFADTVAYPE